VWGLVVDPLGQLVDCSTSYKPTQELTDKIILRDRTCTMIGCHRAACRCELDHVEPFDGTNTIEPYPMNTVVGAPPPEPPPPEPDDDPPPF
jgi:hypothetical protein